MSLKLEFVERAMKPGARISVLCRDYGISRETGYKWLNRYKKSGPDGLEEMSRRPKSTPLATAEEIVLSVLDLRERQPRRGPKKLHDMLERKLGNQTPSVGTIARILRRAGKVRQRSRFRRLSIIEKPPDVVALAPNDVWTVDFKGWWRAQDGQRCEPLTVRDAFSRYVLAIRVMRSPSMAQTRRVFEELFRRNGVPTVIQCDNGSPFIHVQSRGGLTRLSAWWISLGIRVVRSRPGCPQDNGGHERMHADMSGDLEAHPSATAGAQQHACSRWRVEFNNVRPHEALKGAVPADVYKPSKRRPLARRYLYPSTWIVRTVSTNGAIKIQDVGYAVGKALIGLRVALEPLGELKHRLWFRDLDLGTLELAVSDRTIDEATRKHLAKRLSAA